MQGKRTWRVWVSLLFLFPPASALAQVTTLPPAPVPIASPQPILGRPVPVAPAPSPAPLALSPPPAGPIFPAAPPGDPGPDGWGPLGSVSDTEGLFFNSEVAFVFPALKFRLFNDQPLPFTGLQLRVPAVDLDPTVMPTFELGYRLGKSDGYFVATYNFLITEGTGSRTTDLGTFDVRTRVNAQNITLDYGTTPYEFWPRYEISWRIGARISDVFFDSRASNAMLIQSASNDFFGAGPHARFDIERRIVPVPGLSLVGRVDGAAIVGRVRQRYNVDIAGLHDSASARRGQLVPYLNLQAGLSYAPPELPGVKFTLGYLFEDYFNVGRLGIDGTGTLSQSRGELWSHGVFLRGQIDF